MASSSSRGVVIHQDYIARIRYSNTLPPPPNPPKLLDIPNTGLASGQYTAPGFASRLARDQPLNIEADAELGMPLDLVGMPGIFDGDESSIQAPSQIPAVHPHDRALLRPLSTLGKPKFSDTSVSFLRRTEYISSYTSKSRFDSTTSRSLIDNTGSRTKKPAQNINKESPEYIKSQVEKSFEDAAKGVKNPTAMRHPSKKNLKCVAAYPLLPDRTGFTDTGGYCAIKFLTNPVPPSSTYDIRLTTSILRPIPPTEEEEALYELAERSHKMDPENFPPPPRAINYEFFLPTTDKDSQAIKRKFDTLDPESASDDLYTSKKTSGPKCFRLKRLRAYETASISGSPLDMYDDEVALSVYDGTDGVHEKAAYYYPICQKIAIRPQRSKNINIKLNRYASQNEVEDDLADYMELRVEDPNEEVEKQRSIYLTQPWGEEVEVEEEAGEKEREKSQTPAGDSGAEKDD